MRHYRFVIVLFPGASLENCFRKVPKNDSDETAGRMRMMMMMMMIMMMMMMMKIIG